MRNTYYVRHIALDLISTTIIDLLFIRLKG